MVSCAVEINGDSRAEDEWEIVTIGGFSHGVAGTADVDAADIGFDALMTEAFVGR